jgi:hypothetical protein
MKPKPDEVQRVLDELSETDIKQIRKENPFRNERNAGIRKLCDKGVKMAIIAEISGLCDNTITRIRRREHTILD